MAAAHPPEPHFRLSGQRGVRVMGRKRAVGVSGASQFTRKRAVGVFSARRKSLFIACLRVASGGAEGHAIPAGINVIIQWWRHFTVS